MIETPRLHIREFVHADFEALFALVSNPQVMRFSDAVESDAAAQARLEGYIRSYRERGFGKWAVEEKRDRRIIGYCGFGAEEFGGTIEPELGFRFLPAYWGVGLATEAAGACSEYGLARFGFPGFLGFAHAANLGSCRVLDKIGMRFCRLDRFHGSEVRVYEMKRTPNNALQTTRWESFS